MMKLYAKKGCPFCKKVLDSLHEEIGVPFCVVYVGDEAVKEELIERGGEKKVPFLVDDEQGVELYESDDIIAHLKEKYM